MPTVSVPNNFTNNTAADAEEVDANFAALVSYINTNCVLKDASVAFTAVPSGPATNPSSDNQLARKAYVDAGDAASAAALASAVAAVECRLSKSTTLATGASTLSSWTEVADTNGFYTAADDAIVIPSGQAGWYGIWVEVDGNGSNMEEVRVAVAGSSGGALVEYCNLQSAFNATGISVWSYVAYLDVADEVSVAAASGAGGLDTAKSQDFKFGVVKLS